MTMIAQSNITLLQPNALALHSGTWLRRLAVPLFFICVWELAARQGWIDVRFLSSPSQVIEAVLQWIFGVDGANPNDPYVGTWLNHALESSFRVYLGFMIATVIGTVAGILVGSFSLAEDLLDGSIQILRPIPVTAFVPFAIIVFGIRTPAAVFLIALGAFFPIYVNTVAGVRGVPRVYIRAARMLGTPKSKILPWIIFPAALPSIVTGLRLGIGLAWVLVIVSEMIAVKSGLGFVLWDAYYFLRMDVIIVAMLSVGVLGFLSDKIILVIGRRILRWHEGKL